MFGVHANAVDTEWKKKRLHNRLLGNSLFGDDRIRNKITRPDKLVQKDSNQLPPSQQMPALTRMLINMGCSAALNALVQSTINSNLYVSKDFKSQCCADCMGFRSVGKVSEDLTLETI